METLTKVFKYIVVDAFEFLVGIVVFALVLLGPAYIAGFIWDKRIARRVAYAHLGGAIAAAFGYLFTAKDGQGMGAIPCYIAGAIAGGYLARRVSSREGDLPGEELLPENDTEPRK